MQREKAPPFQMKPLGYPMPPRWRGGMAHSTRLAVVPFFLAISGYGRLVTTLMYSVSFMVSRFIALVPYAPLLAFDAVFFLSLAVTSRLYRFSPASVSVPSLF